MSFSLISCSPSQVVPWEGDLSIFLDVTYVLKYCTDQLNNQETDGMGCLV